jgi:transposase
MERYIGMDVHAMSCTLCIVGPSGRELKSDVVETNGQVLVEYLRAIPRPRHLCIEEGTQSAWLHEILSPHVDELVVVGVTRSRGAKSDAKDALGLAQALRLGAIDTTVFKAPSRFARLRALATSYDQITCDVTRTQTRIKALFRARGIPTPGQVVYSPAQRSQWLEKLPEACRPSAELLWQELDAQRQLKREAEKQLVGESHRHPISKILETCPGFGPIRTALSVPVVVTPNRFRTSRQFWSYSGLGIVMRSSADWVKRSDGWVRAETAKTRGLNRCFNRTLKYVFKGAATTVITKLPGSPLQQRYAKLLEGGTKPNLAKLTLARAIAATFLSMWKHEETYDPARHRAQ